MAGVLVPLSVLGALTGCSSDGAETTPDCRVSSTDRTAGPLVWSDDFDGHEVDRRRWTVRDRDKLSFDQAAIRADNATVRDGLLRLTARRESAGGRRYTTAYLDTIGRFSRQYGRWEIRARLPVAPGRSTGLWPAFWLRGDRTAGEVDVLEAWGTPVTTGRRLGGSAAWAVHEDTNRGPGARSVSGWAGPARLDRDFHTFAVDRTPHCLRFSVDGRTTGVVAVDDHAWTRPALDGPLNMRLNLQVGGAYWGRVSRTTTRLPAVFEVDRVRVYALHPRARDTSRALGPRPVVMNHPAATLNRRDTQPAGRGTEAR